ncbi:MAG: hypothetical protein PVH68_21290 [Armatimonadota bacterium]|jgi:hypothetical protein
MSAKGMRDVATVQTLVNRSVPASRAQIVTQLARMEHEKARLERELGMWTSKQQQTQGRLAKVQHHIASLQRALDQALETRYGLAVQARARGSRSRRAAGCREIQVEY